MQYLENGAGNLAVSGMKPKDNRLLADPLQH